MIHLTDPTTLTELGLTGYRVGPWEPLVRQQHSELRMFQADVQTLGRLLKQDTETLLDDAAIIGNRQAERLGFSFYRIKQRFVLLESSSLEPLEVRPAALPEDVMWSDPDGGAILLDPVHPGTPEYLVILRSGGWGLVLKLDVKLTRCHLAPVMGKKTLGDEPRFETPLREWLPTYDDWFQEQVKDCLRYGDPWLEIVALGMAPRLAVTARRSGELEAVMEGHQVLHGELQWAREHITQDALSWLGERAILMARELREGLDAILELAFVDADNAWQVEALDAMHQRDELASAQLILEACGSHTASHLRVVLEALDDEGRSFIDTVPPFSEAAQDERLRRAAGANPMVWWVEPAELWTELEDDLP